jgi:diadenosine tetraphosphatase ApaH/serine/threonine PP2A family protein phosphatase
MRYAVISDIHGNLEALEAALDALTRRGFDALLVLGDLVGYCADPNGVTERIRNLCPLAVIRGNHDKVASGIEEPEGFNAVARLAVQWTYDALTPDNRKYLADLPQGPLIVDDVLEICHGTPFDEDAYVFDELDAVRALKSTRRPACLFGHTHLPVSFELTGNPEGLDLTMPGPGTETVIRMRDGVRYLVNPGSVGQPRDGDPRAAFALVDTSRREIALLRQVYPVETAQAKVVAAGLPEVLALRLQMGR